MLNYTVITPVRNEARYIENTIASVTSQTILPSEWIVVDDGSTDGTGEILDRYAAEFSWIKVIHRANRGYFHAGGGVEAFCSGYSALTKKNWDFIVNLDGDLSFSHDYFEECFEQFSIDPQLGIGGGTVYRLLNNELKVDSAGDPPFHVRGATKIYRRACWDQISPLVQGPGWDTIDEVKANSRGWTTRTFANVKLIQHKPTGDSYGNWNNYFRNGLANYVTGYHPIFMLGKCVKRGIRRPFSLESIALLAGFCSGYLKKIQQVQDITAIQYLRKQQIRRILLRSSIYG